MNNLNTFLPVKPEERILLLDALRGFALFGILIVNMDYFVHPMQTILVPLPETISYVDRFVAGLVKFFAEGKFYSIFSLLFGYGFMLIMQRAEIKGRNFLPYILRRYFLLLIIGIIHAFFIWVGDILIVYSICGLLLIFFRKAKPKTLIIWIIILFSLPILFNLLGTAAVEFGKMFPEGREAIEKSFAEQETKFKQDIEKAYQVYSTGNFSEILNQRVYDMKFMAGSIFFIVPGIFMMFLLGMYFARIQIFQNLESNIKTFKKLFLYGLSIGIAGNLIYASIILDLPRFEPSFKLFIASFGQSVGVPALSLFYISAFVLYYNSNPNSKVLKVFSPVGKIALSIYILQSIVCTTIFYGYGLGCFGKISKLEGLILSFVIYFVLLILGNLYSKKFPFGPLEYLWRWFTYLKKPKVN